MKEWEAQEGPRTMNESLNYLKEDRSNAHELFKNFSVLIVSEYEGIKV